MEIRDEVKKYIGRLQKISRIIAEVDMMASLTTVAEENAYIKPNITLERNINIKEGRHPVVEKVIKDDYIANDVIMDDECDILLITGPNMAGKSTYMRQLAIIVIMAQIGSFVPAKKCSIPIFDKIFTRIGASDDLVSGDSTFMVEMKEANTAITEATENSLILFDNEEKGLLGSKAFQKKHKEIMKDKQKELQISRRILAVVFAVIGLCAWEGYISILIIFAKVLSTLAYGTTNMKKMRLMISVTCCCWICYNYYVGSIAGVISDACNLTSVVIGMIRYDILKKEEPQKTH